MPELPPVVLLAGARNAVSAARSLAKSGVRVHAICLPTDCVAHSRYCAEYSDVGSREGVQDRYLDWLEHGPRGAVVLPCDDDGLELIARRRSTLLDWGYRPVEANDEALLAMLDKARTYALAEAAGVPVPWTATVRTRADAEAVAGKAEYPCGIKPLYSHRFAHHFGILAKVIVVADRAELMEGFDLMLKLGVEALITEIVPGGDDQFCSYYTYIDERGEPLFHFTKAKVRQWPTGFGLTCYQVTNWNPEVAELGLRFVQGAGLRGVANVEFKLDPRDGHYKLIECNHRFTAANELVRLAGIDIPLLAYNRLAGRPGPSVDHYRTGVRMWDPVEDLRALAQYRRRGELTVAEWARSLMHRQHLPLLRWDDPMPTVAANVLHARRLGRTLVRRHARAGGRGRPAEGRGG